MMTQVHRWAAGIEPMGCLVVVGMWALMAFVIGGSIYAAVAQ